MLSLAGVALCAAMAACAGRGAQGAPEGDWDLAGVIAAVEPGPTATRVSVDAHSGEGAPGRVVLLVSPDTEVEIRRTDGTDVRGSAADLRTGARIQARHDGAEMRSLPPQYRATHVRVLAAP
ncbi:MAG TPA: hypothetical protein VHG28_20030 [Longimicrobiaceae bacterium]|nr:hypothetical protein [Longimicrobiaceae bacterium]